MYVRAGQEKGSLVRRLLHKRAVSALVIAPAVAFTLLTPSIAHAAECAGLDTTGAGAQSAIVYTDDVFSTNAEFNVSQQTYADPSAGSSNQGGTQEVINSPANNTSACSATGSGVGSDTSASGSEAKSPSTLGNTSTTSNSNLSDNKQIADNSGTNSYTYDSVNVDASENATNDDVTDDSGNVGNVKTLIDGSDDVYLDGAFNKPQVIIKNAMEIQAVQTTSDDVTYYDSHEADIIFSAGEGGTISSLAAAGSSSSNTQNSSSEGHYTFTEHFTDSLAGISEGALATPLSGYHFVKWIDLTTGETLSDQAKYIPERPEEGWPYTWQIQAVFAPNIYIVKLHTNGGKSPDKSDTVTLEVTPGSNFQLPANGTDFSFSRTGYAFNGWNTIEKPSATSSKPALAIADGAILDDEFESLLQDLGIVKLDWTDGTDPVLNLYAQWMAGMVTITYKASEGGVLSVPASVKKISDSMASEAISASNGAHIDTTISYGPSGASVSASKHYHFKGWTVSGSNGTFTDTEASSKTISSDTASRLSYFSEYEGMPAEYHDVTFGASFAPNSYVFSYGANEGTGSVASTTYTYGSPLVLASTGLIRTGYTLTGWNTSADGTGTAIALGESLTDETIESYISKGLLSDEDGAVVTLYAQWKKDAKTDPSDPGTNPSDPGTNPSDPGTNPSDPGTTPSDPGNNNNGGSTNNGSGTSGTNTGTNGTSNQGSNGSSSGSGSGSSSNASNSNGASANRGTSSITNRSSSSTNSSATPSNPAAAVSTEIASKAQELAKTLSELISQIANGGETVAPGALAAAVAESGASQGPVVIADAVAGAGTGSTSAANSNGSSSLSEYFAEMTPSEAVEATSNSITAVATVGAIAGLVGMGASVAGATAIGATAIGTASTVGLSSAADLAADLAANAADTAAEGAQGFGFAFGRRKRDDDDEEQEQEDEH